jgi:hypothetical protein
MESTTKRNKIVKQSGKPKRSIITYHRFYSVKYCVALEQRNKREIEAFFNISDATYYRILAAKNYPDYVKRFTRRGDVMALDKSERRTPVDYKGGVTKQPGTKTLYLSNANVEEPKPKQKRKLFNWL